MATANAIKYVSPAENSGYGLSAQAYVLGLLDQGLRVSWHPMVQGSGSYVPWHESQTWDVWLSTLADRDDPGGMYGERVQECVGRTIDYDTVIMHTVPEYWPSLVEPHKRNIGYTAWETDRIPPAWQDLLEIPDRLVVPSSFTREVFASCGVRTPIDVVPHIYRPAAPVTQRQIDLMRLQYAIPADYRVFYTINTWTARKALWNTLNAFLLEMTEDDEAILVVKSSARGVRHASSPETAPVWSLINEITSSYPDPGHVRLIDRDLGRHEVAALHALGDVYLSLTHGEGWGLGAFEAAAAGKPVIATGWGGSLDYLSGDGAWLVDYELCPVVDAQGQDSYRRDQKWAMPSIESAMGSIRWIHDNRTEAGVRSEALAASLAREFSSDRVTALLLQSIDSARSS